MPMTYIFFPTRTELEPLLGLMEGLSEGRTGLRESFSGILRGRTVKAVVSGVGQANTAQSISPVLESGAASVVIMGGCAGAYAGSGLLVGDVAVATEEVYADLGAQTPEGWKSLEELGLPLLEKGERRYYDRFPLDLGAYEGALRAFDLNRLRPAAQGSGRLPGVHFGPFLTVSVVSGTAKRGDELYARHRALCENMEGAAAAQVAVLYGVPFIEVRGISNMVEDRDRGKWDIQTAAYNCAMAISCIINNSPLLAGEGSKG